MTNYYIILNVSEYASVDEIKKSYRKLAKKFHPDANNGFSYDKFKEICEAYSILSDPIKRKKHNEELHPKSFQDTKFSNN